VESNFFRLFNGDVVPQGGEDSHEVRTRNSFGAVSSVMLSCSGMKAAERESPFQMALTTQATDLRDLLAAGARRRDVHFVAVSARDEHGVVRPADDPLSSKTACCPKKRSTMPTTTSSPSIAQSCGRVSRIFVILILVIFLGCAKKPQQPDVTSLPQGSPTPQSAPTSGR
jgi:hypothetical protein